MKKYELGLICGRFTHIHKGHQLIINKSIELCKKTLIFVGSSQESKTLRNPFSADLRVELIKKVYNTPEVEIEKLEDMTNEFDVTDKWGQYVIDKTIEYEGRFADLIVSGNDEIRKDWFSEEQMKGVDEILIDRNEINISATELRGYILLNDKESWSKFVPEQIIEDFEKIRNELIEVQIYKKILDEIGNNKTIENYKTIYEKYEKEDRKQKIKNIKKS